MKKSSHEERATALSPGMSAHAIILTASSLEAQMAIPDRFACYP